MINIFYRKAKMILTQSCIEQKNTVLSGLFLNA
jgi:hypothetical protein